MFLLVAVEEESLQELVFEISERKNDLKELCIFLLDKKPTLIGFNNLAYDNLIVEFIKNNYKKWLTHYKNGRYDIITDLIKKESDRIIESTYIPYTSGIDIFKVNHYDNKNRRCSLKYIQATTNWRNVQDSPIGFNELVVDYDSVIEYCRNDVLSTYSIYSDMKKNDVFSIRKRLSEIYGVDFTNYNNSKIGEKIIIHELAKKLELSEADLLDLRTSRSSIIIKDLLFDIYNFQSTEFNLI